MSVLILFSALSPFLAFAQIPPPKTMLWAWEVREDLRFLKSPDVGVAFLATCLLLREQTVLVRRRMQPLRVPPNTPMVAVVRIESDARKRPALSSAQRSKALELIVGVVHTTGRHPLAADA